MVTTEKAGWKATVDKTAQPSFLDAVSDQALFSQLRRENLRSVGLFADQRYAADVDIHPAQAPSEYTPILRLPNELLDQVFRVVRSFGEDDGFRCKADLVSIASTCRRFYHVAIPVIYASPRSDQYFMFGHPEPRSDEIGLVTTLIQKPELFGMIKMFALHIEAGINQFDLAFQSCLFLATSMVNLTHLHLSVVIDNASEWRALEASLQKLRRLQTLKLRVPVSRAVPLHLILKACELPSLRTLEIQDGDFRSVANRFSDDPSEILEDSVPEIEGSSNSMTTGMRTAQSGITTLHLDTTVHRPRVLRELLKWPKSLKHLSFADHSRLECDPDISQYEWHMTCFYVSLRAQRASLNTLKLCSVPPSSSRLFNFCDFPELESVTMAHTSLASLHPEEAAKNILGPKLGKLTLDQPWQNTMLAYETFNQDNAQWLLEFAEFAQAQRSALREINLHLSTNMSEYSDFIGRIDLSMTDAWTDMLERLKQDIVDLGINCAIDAPTKEAFHEFSDRGTWVQRYSLLDDDQQFFLNDNYSSVGQDDKDAECEDSHDSGFLARMWRWMTGR